jgi:amino acid adenylation domain-containing protein
MHALPEGSFERVRLDADWSQIERESGENCESTATEETLAYVIYTSGSTGTPKGVEAVHRASVNRLAWMWQAYPFENGEVCCQKTTLSFVDSIWEIFGPLLAGVPSVILSQEDVRDPRVLVSRLSAAGVSRIVLVPSLLSALLDSGIDARSLPKLKWWVTSGETLAIDLYRRFRETMPDAVLINLYGSSEVSADVTCWDSRGREPLDSVPIGRPIANTQLYVLDEFRQPVPIGVSGELYVGGEGLARGYRNRPDTTAERFVPDPFRGAPGARLFKTGDRGRYREDGQIEYLGRTDFQIKLHGRRIEPGEIESALGAHPSVSQVVVSVREDQHVQARLVAYVVSRSLRVPTVAELRGFLRRRLPDYMLPSAFVFLETLPLTPSGKIDRAALPRPDPSRPELEAVFVPPRNAAETAVARIWREVLGLNEVGVHDNFFDLGGHSLLAVQVAARIEKQFGRPVALASIFRAPTVGELAQMFGERRRKRRGSPSLVAIQPNGTRPPFFCVHANTGIVHYRGLARLLGPDQPFYGLQSQGLDGARAPYETVEEMAAQYVKEVLAVQTEGPYYLGGYSFGGKVAFEMARQLRAQGQRTAFLGFFDTFNMPLTPGPTRLEIARKRTRVHIAALRKARRRERLVYLMRRAETLRSLVGRALSLGYEALFQPLRRAQRKVLAANTRAARRYVASYYEGNVTIFRATDRASHFRDRFQTYPHLGWEKLCGEGVEIREVPGGHSSLMEEEANVRTLGEILGECLREAQYAEMAGSIRAVATQRETRRLLTP